MKKIYFASDFHLGVDARLSSKDRELQIVAWLDTIKHDAAEIYLVGDVFDYWFEYGAVIPKGFVHLFGKLAELRAANIPIYFFTGNHDMWMFRYFEEELDIPIYREPIVREFNGQKFFIGHGDGLGPGDYGYKFIKWLFAHPVAQWFFARLHPNFGLWLMRLSSGKSREATDPAEKSFMGPEKERLVTFCNEELDQQSLDYFVFGHRHLPINYMLKNAKSRYINLGDWLYHNSYGVFDGKEMKVLFYKNDNGKIYTN